MAAKSVNMNNRDSGSTDWTEIACRVGQISNAQCDIINKDWGNQDVLILIGKLRQKYTNQGSFSSWNIVQLIVQLNFCWTNLLHAVNLIKVWSSCGDLFQWKGCILQSRLRFAMLKTISHMHYFDMNLPAKMCKSCELLEKVDRHWQLPLGWRWNEAASDLELFLPICQMNIFYHHHNHHQHCHMVIFYRHHHHHQHCQMNIFLSCMNILFDHHQHYREVIDITIVVSYVSLLAPTGALVVMMVYYISAQRQLFQILSIQAFLYCYKCHSKSLKQYQCNWCHRISWGYFGDILGIFLEYFWDILGIYWGYFWYIFWDILEIFWGYFEDIFGIFLGLFLEYFWGYFGDILGIFLVYFGDILGIFGGYFGNILGDILGIFREYFWDIWGYYGDILGIC